MNGVFEQAFRGRRVLVTGGAGFVGGAVAQRLVELGAQVTVLDDLFTGLPETVPNGARFVQGSVTDQALINDLVAENALVFHARRLKEFVETYGGGLWFLCTLTLLRWRIQRDPAGRQYNDIAIAPAEQDDDGLEMYQATEAARVAVAWARRRTPAVAPLVDR